MTMKIHRTLIVALMLLFVLAMPGEVHALKGGSLRSADAQFLGEALND